MPPVPSGPGRPALALVAYLVAARRVAPVPPAHRRTVLARLGRRPGTDQPASRAAPPAPGPGRGVLARRHVPGPVLGGHRAAAAVDVREFDRSARGAGRGGGGGQRGGARAAGAAIAEYRGELLPGVYEDWLSAPRSRIERQCMELCDLLCRIRTQTGDLGRSRGGGPAADRAGAAGGGRLPRADGAAGRSGRPGRGREHLPPLRFGAGARARHRARRTDTRRHSCADGSRRGRHAAASGSGPPPARPGPAAAKLVGRSRGARAAAGPLWRAAAAGHPGSCWSAATRGSGKTRLVAELAELARLARRGGGQHPVLRRRGAAGAGAGGGLAAQRRRSGRRPRRSSRCGAPRSTGWCRPRPAAASRGAGRGPWSTPGNDTASSRAWPAR